MSLRIRLLLVTVFIASMALAQTALYHNEWIDYSKTYYKFKVMGFGLDANNMPVRNGIVRIPYSTLTGAGLANVPAENIQLWHDGEEVPVYVSTPSGALGSNDYIEFYGEINSGRLDNELYRNPDFQLSDKWSLQTDTAAYFLTVSTVGANKRLETTVNNVAANILPADSFFMHTVGRYYRSGGISEGFSASLIHNLYSSSYDRGEGWVSRAIHPVGSSCGTATLPQSFANLYPFLNGPQMTLRVNSVGDMQNSRTVRINLNTDSITTFQMDYINYVKDEELIDVNKISGGSATIYIVNQSPSSCDEMRASMIELTYPRMFNMGGASMFTLTLDASATGRYLEITNFNKGNAAPVVYDLTNGKRYVADTSIAGMLMVVLEPSVDKYNLVITTQDGAYYKQITTLQSHTFVDFSNPGNQGDYLIISNPLIYGSGSNNYVEQYRQYRASNEGGGYDAKIVDINELVDQFAFGVKKHPLSIKNFLRFARDNFSITPKFTFLIGKGVTYNDYRNNESNALADQLNLVPTWGNPASDNLLASNDMNALPATPIGRLSAVSPQEVGDYLQKVKEYEATQRDTSHTIEDRGWMKNVLQIAGANDISLGNQLDAYLENYKSIISDTAFGANVIDFSKTKNPAGYPAAISSFKNIYEHGAALITYFGHSSATSLDFNLDDPMNYNNQYKYPVFLANGCTAGNHFMFEPGRLNTKSTISEKFVLAPERGAIGYLASTHYGVVNYLDTYTKDFYEALGGAEYNQSIGAVLQNMISTVLASTGVNDYFSRCHAEEYAFHGDPAIRINGFNLPDYAIEQPQIEVSPSFISVADTAFAVKVKVHNLGKAVNKPVTLKITRTSPNGEVTTTSTTTFAAVNLVDSFTLNVPIVANRDKGVNTINAFADYTGSINELSENNNGATVDVTVSENEIRPVYPYNFAIIDQPVQKLYASTVNPLDTPKQYVMELDTTSLFNSPSKVVKTDTSAGGIVEFDPSIPYSNGTTYYWRVAPAAVEPHWVNASFVYKSGVGVGFQQGHLYQNLQSKLERLKMDSVTGHISYQDKLHNIFVTNSIYPTSGTEDGHFSVALDGSISSVSACVGSSVIFTIIDPLTFLPKANTTNPYGAAPVCAAGREYNFEYQYTTAAKRKSAMNFMDSIVPNGWYVAVRLVLDQPYNIFASTWAADTTLYGSGNSLYHRLKKAGFAELDSFYYPRTWAFVYKKGDTSFTPAYAFSDGLYDRITLSANCITSNAEGTITSPVFGPANQWQTLNWSGFAEEVGNDVPVVKVYGVDYNNTDSLLYSLDSAQHSFSLASVDAAHFPFVKLQMSNADSVTATPYQLRNWNIAYLPVPEGAIAPNIYMHIPDSIGTIAQGNLGLLHVGVAFKNVSKADFNALRAKVILYDSLRNPVFQTVQNLHALMAGDTLHVDFDIDVNNLSGLHNLYVQFNPNNEQPEQYSFNNFLYKYVFIGAQQSTTLPVILVNFNAVLQGNDVIARWKVNAEEKTSRYEVQHSMSGADFITIGEVQSQHVAGTLQYSFTHMNASAGKNYYRLKVVDEDGHFFYSAVRTVMVGKPAMVKVYPNPVKDKLSITISQPDKPCDVRILNARGQQVWHRRITSSAEVNTAIWGSGMYIVEVKDGTETSIYKVQKQ